MLTRIRPLIGALIRMIRPGLGSRALWLVGRSARFGRGGEGRIAAESVEPALLTRADVFVIWERNVYYVKYYYKWCSRMDDRSKDLWIYIYIMWNCWTVINVCQNTWLKCTCWGIIPSYALWMCRRGGASVDWINPLNCNQELSLFLLPLLGSATYVSYEIPIWHQCLKV